MAHNVAKIIQIVGPAQDLVLIYRHAQNICDSWITYTPDTPLQSPESAELGILVELLGGDPIVINGHGWSSIESVDADKSSVDIECVTPYGNLSELMDWFRKRFPLCDFYVWKDVSTEETPDCVENNEFD